MPAHVHGGTTCAARDANRRGREPTAEDAARRSRGGCRSRSPAMATETARSRATGPAGEDDRTRRGGERGAGDDRGGRDDHAVDRAGERGDLQGSEGQGRGAEGARRLPAEHAARITPDTDGHAREKPAERPAREERPEHRRLEQRSAAGAPTYRGHGPGRRCRGAPRRAPAGASPRGRSIAAAVASRPTTPMPRPQGTGRRLLRPQDVPLPRSPGASSRPRERGDGVGLWTSTDVAGLVHPLLGLAPSVSPADAARRDMSSIACSTMTPLLLHFPFPEPLDPRDGGRAGRHDAGDVVRALDAAHGAAEASRLFEGQVRIAGGTSLERGQEIVARPGHGRLEVRSPGWTARTSRSPRAGSSTCSPSARAPASAACRGRGGGPGASRSAAPAGEGTSSGRSTSRLRRAGDHGVEGPLVGAGALVAERLVGQEGRVDRRSGRLPADAPGR